MSCRPVLAVLGAAALALPAGAGGASATPAPPTVSATPRSQYVLVPVRLRGAHWKVTVGCTRAVRLTLRLTSGDAVRLRGTRVRANGSFAAAWIPPRYTSGLVRVIASQACTRRFILAATSFMVLPTP